MSRFLLQPRSSNNLNRDGEHWGRHWLDLARYADSDGAYWIQNAHAGESLLKQDKSFKKFPALK